jgi:ribosomal-protein-alanine N-acetyltransferase
VVAPHARGHGLGARLVACAEREARANACAGVSLEVRADNEVARSLYRSLGYLEHALLPAYYDDGAPGVRLRRHFVGTEQ